MVDFWDLISATFFIIGKFRYPQNVSYRSCSDIAEYYLVRFWDPQVEIGLRYGLCKNHTAKWPGIELAEALSRTEFWRVNMKFRDTVKNRYSHGCPRASPIFSRQNSVRERASANSIPGHFAVLIQILLPFFGPTSSPLI